MNWPRQVAGVTVFLLLVPIILGGLSVFGCKTATQVIVERDSRVFTLFAGLVAVGYGEGQADPSSESLRTQLKEALADWTQDDLYPMTWLEKNYRPDQLVAATLKLGPPPDFASDGQSLAGLQHFLVTLWKDVEPLYKTNSAAEIGELTTMNGPAAAAIQGAIDYAGGRAPHRTWRVVPEALALPGCACGYRDEPGRMVWVIVGRAPGSWERDLTREAFRVVVHDELTRLETEGALARFEPVLERVRPSGGLSGYVEDNLVRALTARTVVSANAETALNEAAKSGFVLAPAFCERLADYEASGMVLTDYLGTLLAAADVEEALALARAPPPPTLSESDMRNPSVVPAFPLPSPWEWKWLEGENPLDGFRGGVVWLPSVLLPEGTPLYFPLAGEVSRFWLSALPPQAGFGVGEGKLFAAIMAESSLWPADRLLWETFSCEKGEKMCRLQAETRVWALVWVVDEDDLFIEPVVGEELPVILRMIVEGK
jgi:hypothetical protein